MNRRMRVAIIGSTSNSETGPSRVTTGLVQSLQSNKNIEIFPITYGDEVLEDTHHLDVSPGPLPDFRLQSKLYSKIKDLNVDLVHALEQYIFGADIRTFQWFSSQLIRRRHARKEYDGFPALVSEMLTAIPDVVAPHKYNIATSPKTASEVPRNIDSIIPLGVKHDLIAEEINESGGIVVPGRVNQKKGQEKILSDLPQSNVVGSCDQEIKNKYPTHIFHGFVGRKRYLDLLSNNKIAIISSRHEMFGLTMLEALATGCVVVTTKNVGMATYDIVESCEGVFIADNIKGIPKVVDKLMDSELKSEQRSSRDLVKENFTWSNIAEQYSNIYSRIYK